MFKSPSVSPCLMVKSPVSTSFQAYLVTHHVSWLFTILDCKSPVLVVKYCEIMVFFSTSKPCFFHQALVKISCNAASSCGTSMAQEKAQTPSYSLRSEGSVSEALVLTV
jgi:hypothetical protein